MDFDSRITHENETTSHRWHAKYFSKKEAILNWVSTFRDGNLCEFAGDYAGSFNRSVRVRFADGVQWVARFAVPGKVMDPDEKLRREVAVMKLVREQTSIPVPKVHAWGLSGDNPLGLGAFIVMDFIVGESLEKFLGEIPEGSIARLKLTLTEQQLRTVYRQIAGFYLELSKLEFPHVGSFSIGDDQAIRADLGPLTLKMQDIESLGGVKVGGDRSATFKSTQQYFSYVAQQDIDHLRDQANSIDNETDARAKYKARIQLKSIISRFVDNDFDNTNFKLFCDDFRYANMLINNASDLKIVAVLDWEWAYAAPYQMFCSPPRWLTLRMPNHMATFDGPDATRFKGCLNIFLDELELEEVRRNEMTPLAHPQKKLADYMRESLTNGRFWFHELMRDSFLGADDLAWQMICQLHPDIDTVAPVSASELDAFAATKMAELEKYNAEWAAMKAKIDAEKASLEDSLGKATLNDLEADGDGTNH